MKLLRLKLVRHAHQEKGAGLPCLSAYRASLIVAALKRCYMYVIDLGCNLQEVIRVRESGQRTTHVAKVSIHVLFEEDWGCQRWYFAMTIGTM
jgi:hypothetical protein